MALSRQTPLSQRIAKLPYWLFAFMIIIVFVGVTIVIDEDYSEAFNFIRMGLWMTIRTSLIAYVVATTLGIIFGVGRISRNVVIKNIATFYVEIIRGIPMIVLIFYIALVAVPGSVRLLNSLGEFFLENKIGLLGNLLTSFENKDIPMVARAVIALAVTYGAFLAEIFRAGIQSIPRGQMEAARSLGMGYGQAMTHIILPQAIRNVLPALGNDFIAMVKDSSLVSILAVRDIAQMARLYAGSSFRYPEAYTTLAVLYLSMTVILSLVLGAIERWLRADER